MKYWSEYAPGDSAMVPTKEVVDYLSQRIDDLK